MKCMNACRREAKATFLDEQDLPKMQPWKWRASKLSLVCLLSKKQYSRVAPINCVLSIQFLFHLKVLNFSDREITLYAVRSTGLQLADTKHAVQPCLQISVPPPAMVPAMCQALLTGKSLTGPIKLKKCLSLTTTTTTKSLAHISGLISDTASH